MAIRHKNLKMKLTALAVAFAVGMQPIVATAGLQTQMESIFNSMTNTSKPGVYEGVSRGMITGGELSIHNRIVHANIISLSPPDWKIGCGGIDFYGGSFSFINADQLVQLMRAIAANASGYAFSLAVDFISTTIGLNIKEWLNQIQEWVRKFSNSCEMAKSVVNAGWNSEPWQSFLKEIQSAAAQHGLTQDQSDAAQNNNQVLGAQTPEGKRMLGNIVYRAIMEQKASKWTEQTTVPATGSATEEEDMFAEEMMSLYGTVIISLKDQSGNTVDGNEAASKKDQSNYNIEHMGSILSFKDIFRGGKLDLYQCTGKGGKSDFDTYCTEMTVVKDKFVLPELTHKFKEILLGKDYRSTGEVGGVVGKWNNPSLGENTAIEKYLVSNLPASIGYAIQKLSQDSAKKAAEYVESAIPILTIEILNNMVKQFGKAVRDAVNAAKGSGQSVPDAIKTIAENERKIQSDIDDLRKTYGDVSTALERYNILVNATSTNQLPVTGTVSGDRGKQVTYPTGTH